MRGSRSAGTFVLRVLWATAAAAAAVARVQAKFVRVHHVVRVDKLIVQQDLITNRIERT